MVWVLCLGTRSPVGQQFGEVGGIDSTVTIQFAEQGIFVTPEGEENCQIGGIDHTIAVEVCEALALVGNPVRIVVVA